MNVPIYDLAGIGIGPFNLGLAAMAEPTGLQTIFLDTAADFNWHAGLMLDFATLQVPFYADLVTGADPQSRFSYFAFLKSQKRMFRFGILEDIYLTRKEYNEYCRWVAGQLPSLRFNHLVIAIAYRSDLQAYEISALAAGQRINYLARHIVIGVGTIPHWPACIDDPAMPGLLHSSTYLHHREELLTSDSIALIGSGQSAAEIFYDLLKESKGRLQRIDWFTRASRLYPMDTSKFSLELASPDYIQYFHSLHPDRKTAILRQQDMLYKGINHELLAAIYALLYHRSPASQPHVNIQTATCLQEISRDKRKMVLSFHQTEQQASFIHQADQVILATGYDRKVPAFLEQVRERIQWQPDDLYRVAANYSVDKRHKEIFVQNAELHSHGFNAPDLSLGPYRNAVILNTILGKEFYPLETGVPFQRFGIPPSGY